MVLTDEFADLGRDFGALKAHLTNESARSPPKTCSCSEGLTCHEQLPKGPDVTQSASAAVRAEGGGAAKRTSPCRPIPGRGVHLRPPCRRGYLSLSTWQQGRLQEARLNRTRATSSCDYRSRTEARRGSVSSPMRVTAGGTASAYWGRQAPTLQEVRPEGRDVPSGVPPAE